MVGGFLFTNTQYILSQEHKYVMYVTKYYPVVKVSGALATHIKVDKTKQDKQVPEERVQYDTSY